jgi:hypothetical protein
VVLTGGKSVLENPCLAINRCSTTNRISAQTSPIAWTPCEM